nr:IS21-like element helper ATPase IstB [uncultured Moraxella sp.]
MLNHQLTALLTKLKLHGVVTSLSANIDAVYSNKINFEEALIDACNTELLIRDQKSLDRLIRVANLRYPHACIDDVNFDANRNGLSKQTINRFSECTWVRTQKNMNILGPTGIGKTWLACAFATKACSNGYKTKFFRCSELIDLFEQAVDNSNEKLLIKNLSKFDLIVIDDFGLGNIPSNIESSLLDFIDSFSINGSLLITSQFSYDLWHEKFHDPTIADAILDRIIHNSYTLEVSGDSMRKINSDLTTTL